MQLNINGEQIGRVDEYDYLGIKLDKDLNYKSHIQKVVSCCNERVFTLSKIRKFIPENVAILIYKSLIMSKLSYGGVFCISANKKQLGKLQKLQNRVLRTCYLSDRYTSNIALHSKAHVLPLSLRRKLEICKLMYKRMNDPRLIKVSAPNSRITRYSVAKPPIFVTPRSKKFQDTITYQSSVIWASLPNKTKLIGDEEKFSNEVKQAMWSEFSQMSKI